MSRSQLPKDHEAVHQPEAGREQEIVGRLEAARRFAREAGDLTLEHFQQVDLHVERKADDSPVTAADRAAEARLRERLSADFPADAILGEEFGEQQGGSGYRWILDPIDGTKSFISGAPLYGTLVGLTCDDEPLAGVIYIPALGEMVFAARGRGAWYCKNDREPVRCRVSQRTKLAEGLFVTSEISTFHERGATDAFRELENRAWLMRTWGDCYGYLLVATGRAEVMVDPIMNLWDAAAILPILEEAGGAFTDWTGKPTITSGEGIGANSHVLDEVLEITKRFPKAPAK